MQLTEALAKIMWRDMEVGMALVDTDRRIVRANPCLCVMLGYSEAELNHYRFQDITHPSDAAADDEMARRIFSGDTTRYSIRKRFLSKGGTVVWANVHVSAVPDPNDQTHTYLFFSQILRLDSPPPTVVSLPPTRVKWKDFLAVNWYKILTLASATVLAIYAFFARFDKLESDARALTADVAELKAALAKNTEILRELKQ